MDFERKQRKDFGQVNKFNFIYWSSEIENMFFQTTRNAQMQSDAMSKCKCSYFHCIACGVECKQRCAGKSHVSRRIPVYWLNTEMTN